MEYTWTHHTNSFDRFVLSFLLVCFKFVRWNYYQVLVSNVQREVDGYSQRESQVHSEDMAQCEAPEMTQGRHVDCDKSDYWYNYDCQSHIECYQENYCRYGQNGIAKHLKDFFE